MKKGKGSNEVQMPVTLNDCLLLWQMGYRVEIHDGKVTEVVKEDKKITA